MIPTTLRRKLLALGLCFSLVAAWAQDETAFDNLSLSNLLALALQTGSFLELDLMKSPLSMTVITRDQVNSSGARHLTELLEIYVPGFQYMYNKWNGEIWGMRGVAADRNTKFLFLVNGHKMNHESRDGAMSELNLGLLGDVERVEVLRGPAGLVYGSGAIAGIINIVTRKYEADKVVVQGGLGTWDFAGTAKSLGVDLYQGLENNQSIVFSMGYRASDGLAAEEARLWGRPHWPYPQWLGSAGQASVPSAGCAWCTDGNWRVSLDYEWDRLRIYTRVTHQVSNAGGMFILDPWPEDMGNLRPYDSDRLVDGKNQSKLEFVQDSLRFLGTSNRTITRPDGMDTVLVDSLWDSTAAWRQTWWGTTESWNTNRRQYQVDNIMVEMNYSIPMGDNELKLKAGFDGVTNRIQLEDRKGFTTFDASERNTVLEEAFGERRYSLGASFLWNPSERLQSAVGYELRLDDIGSDLMGVNSQKERPKHKIVSDVLYVNHALFFEGLYQLKPKLYMHSGARFDYHTRTEDMGGIVSPKLGFIFLPKAGHSIKLLYQTSANNGSADNYEYNRNNYDDNGVAYDSWHFEKPQEPPGGNSTPIPGVSAEELHELKPEKVQSIEIAGVHHIENVTIQPSVSLNRVSNLFTWNQQAFRVINAGEYNFINAEVDISADLGRLRAGGSHTYQAILNMNLGSQDVVTQREQFDRDSTTGQLLPSAWETYEGETKYRPVPNGETEPDTINPIKSQITVDGENFLNLNTHISKLYVDFQLLPSLMLHSDVRIFYGLWGRRDLVERDDAGFDYRNIHLDPMVKWNVSLHWSSDQNTRVSLYAYDLLADATGDGAIHSLRWQQSGNSAEHTDLFGLDRRSFAVQVEKTF